MRKECRRYLRLADLFYPPQTCQTAKSPAHDVENHIGHARKSDQIESLNDFNHYGEPETQQHRNDHPFAVLRMARSHNEEKAYRNK